MFWPKSLQSVNTLHTQFVKAVQGSVTIVTIDELDKTAENDQKWPKIWGKNEKNFQKKKSSFNLFPNHFSLFVDYQWIESNCRLETGWNAPITVYFS